MPLEAIQLLGNGKCHGQVSGAFVGHPGVFGRGLRFVGYSEDYIFRFSEFDVLF